MEIPPLKGILLPSMPKEPSEKVLQKPVESKTMETNPMVSEVVHQVMSQRDEDIQQLVENLNQFMKSINYSLQFIPDREAGVVIIKVVDGNGRVIRQIPPEAMQSLSAKIGENIGVLLNSKL